MPASHTPTLRESAAPMVTLVVLAMGWTLLAGKDVGWDLFNHHLYLPFSLLSGRFATDLFAAGPQSYQNPVGYLPFYLLARSAAPSWAVGLALAITVAAPVAWALQRIGHHVLGKDPADRDWRWLAMAAAAASPVLLLTLGTSSTDPLCAALLMVSLAVALDPSPSLRGLVLGGAAMGLAVAIKPTSAVFALPMAAVGMLRPLLGQWRWAAVGTWALASLVAFALAGGFWAWWLYQTFGSPVYPLFNQLFRSPMAPTGVVAALRFLPESGLDYLTRPWVMAQFRPYASTEAFVPDARPLAAAIAGALALAAATVRYGPGPWLRRLTWLRGDVHLGLFLLLSYPLWLATSGNSRYAIVWSMLCGVLLVHAARTVTAQRWMLVGLATALALNLAAYVTEGDHRLIGRPWDKAAYFPVEVPERLRDQPFLHLSIGVQSNAAVAPYLHPAGALVNITGQMSLPTAGPLGDLLRQRLQTWDGRTRFLLPAPARADSKKFAAVIDAENFAQSHRLGLRIDRNDCERLTLLPQTDPAQPGNPFHLLSCAAVKSPRPDAELDRRLAQDRQVFELLEHNCPRFFGPTPMVSEYGPDVTWRRYMNSDARIDISVAEGVFVSHFRAHNPVFLGSAQDVINNGGRDACTAWKRLAIE